LLNSLQNLVNPLVDLDSLCISVWLIWLNHGHFDGQHHVGKKTSETNTKDFFGKKKTQSHHIMKGETLASPNLGNKLQHVAKM